MWKTLHRIWIPCSGPCAALALSILAPLIAAEPEVLFPTDAGVINVRLAPYHAVGDGVADDTQALQKAISDHIDGGTVIYLPNGTYKVSERLDWRRAVTTGANSGWGCNITLQGQSRSGTIIKLANNSIGFNNAAAPKAVIRTASRDEFNQYDRSDGRGNQAFENAIRNLSVVVGTGNSGAIGIDFQVSNWGGLYDVEVRAEGPASCGVAGSRRDNGPGLLQRLKVTGFATGVEILDTPYSLTIDGLELGGQTTVGMRIQGPAAIADLKSTNTVRALQISGLSLVNVLGAQLTGGATGTSAIRLVDGSSYLTVRDVSQQGYGTFIERSAGNVTGTYLGEWVSVPQVNLGQPARGALGLPVQAAPTVQENDFTRWRFAGRPGGQQFSDDLPALQAAMDSGKPVVYLTPGTYRLSNTLRIPATVRLIVGNAARIGITYTDFFSNAAQHKPMFQVIGGAAEPLVIQDVNLSATKPYAANNEAGAIAIMHSSPRTVSVVHSTLIGSTWSYTPEVGAGSVFLTDVVANLQLIAGQSAWCRQLDLETNYNRIRNTGGTLWILGLKSEKAGDAGVLETTAGGRTELIGGTIYATGTSDGTPQFLVSESEASLSFIDVLYQDAWRPSRPVREILGGTVRELTTAQQSWAGYGLAIPLFSSRTIKTPAAPQVSAGAVGRPILSGVASYRATIRILDGGVEIAQVQAGQDGTWSWQPSSPLTPGVHSLQAVVVELNGVSSPPSSAMNVDAATGGTGPVGTTTGAAEAESSGSGGCGIGTGLAVLLAAVLSSLRLHRRQNATA